MKRTLILVFLNVLVGCASNPRPVVPSLEGKPHIQINAAQQTNVYASQPAIQDDAITSTFNFVFQGDIQDALAELKRIQPQINLLPVQGKIFQLPVNVNLQGATMKDVVEDVLLSLDEQVGDRADIIIDKPKTDGEHKILLRFN